MHKDDSKIIHIFILALYNYAPKVGDKKCFPHILLPVVQAKFACSFPLYTS